MSETLWWHIALFFHSFENPYAFGFLIAAATLLVRRVSRRAAVLFFFSIGASFVAGHLLKALFAIPRPSDSLVEAAGASFPSLHATMAAALAASLWWQFGRNRRTLLGRVAGGMAAVLLIVLVSATRVFLGVHTVTDVAAGALLGAGVTLAIHAWGSRRVQE